MIDLKNISKHDFGQYFEYQHTVLNGDEANYVAGCKKAAEYNCRVVFAPYFFASEMREALAGSNTKLGSGVAFPAGSCDTTRSKVACCQDKIAMGYQVLDVVQNQFAVKIGKWGFVEDEFKALRDACSDIELKIILEVCNFTNEEIKHCCELIAKTGINFAKSSTGLFDGPRMDQIEVMKEALKGTDIRVKVAGVKAPRPQNAIAYLKAGVDVLGSQKVFEIIDSLDLMRRMNQI